MPRSCILGVAPGRVKTQAAAPGAACRAERAAKISAPCARSSSSGCSRPRSSSRLMLWTTGGYFVAQVERPLRHRASTRGRWPRGTPSATTPGEAPTTGATSLLHTVVLALAHAARRSRRGARRVRDPAGRRALPRLAAARRSHRHRLAGPREGLLAGRARRALGARRLGLSLRLGHRALPVPGAAAARALARFRGRRLAARASSWRVRCSRSRGRRGCRIALGLALASLAFARGAKRDRLWPLCPGRRGAGCPRACSAWSRGPGSRPRSRRRRSCPTTGRSRRSPGRAVRRRRRARAAARASIRRDVAIGFSRGDASFFFPPLALVFVLLAVVRPEGALRAAGARCGSRSWRWSSPSRGRTSSWASISIAT